ncbi:MAG: DUF5320 domain-containing protein [Candidatus Bathyarchaeota archaeon]|nr:MAG: DUF5320 domain-containing protein [Candidatus Bathyarchaeota archaeon]
MDTTCHWTYCHPLSWYQYGKRRHFLTKEEKKELKEHYKKKKIKWLEDYKESLEKELVGVKERLDDLKREHE